jgi:nicotinamide-nucleotide amidase
MRGGSGDGAALRVSDPAMAETLSPSLPPKVEDLAYRVAKAACDKDLRLVTAESCTGGLVASLLTDIDGCAHAFERGFVTYTDDAKHELVGVPLSLLRDHGAVSAAVARAMALGALAASKGHIALSVTGFAGRGAPDEEPGLVYFGLAGHGRETVVVRKRFGDVGRGAVRLACLEVGLEMLLDAIGP